LGSTFEDVGTNAASIATARRLVADGGGQEIYKGARLSRRDVARHLEVDESTVYRWEKGLRTPRGPLAVRYAELLAELIEVLSDDGAPDPPELEGRATVTIEECAQVREPSEREVGAQ
jgi:DNA-binding XRE family transcriptional regulator